MHNNNHRLKDLRFSTSEGASVATDVHDVAQPVTSVFSTPGALMQPFLNSIRREEKRETRKTRWTNEAGIDVKIACRQTTDARRIGRASQWNSIEKSRSLPAARARLRWPKTGEPVVKKAEREREGGRDFRYKRTAQSTAAQSTPCPWNWWNGQLSTARHRLAKSAILALRPQIREFASAATKGRSTPPLGINERKTSVFRSRLADKERAREKETSERLFDFWPKISPHWDPFFWPAGWLLKTWSNVPSFVTSFFQILCLLRCSDLHPWPSVYLYGYVLVLASVQIVASFILIFGAVAERLLNWLVETAQLNRRLNTRTLTQYVHYVRLYKSYVCCLQQYWFKK